MKVAYRDFKCRNCGHIQGVQTNHTGSCIDYCKNCSWKPSFGKDVAIPFGGNMAYRNFDFSSKSSEFITKAPRGMFKE